MNIELLDRTMNAIENGAEWDQTDWCKCFAGNALRLLGMEPYEEHIDWKLVSKVVDHPTLGTVFVSEAALFELGMDGFQGAVLFFGGNSKETLRRVVNAFIEAEVNKQLQAESLVPEPV